MKTRMFNLMLAYLLFCSIFYVACTKDCPAPEVCDGPAPGLETDRPVVYLAYLNSLSGVLYAVSGYEKNFLDAFNAQPLTGSIYFLPPTPDFPEGMKFSIALSDKDEVNNSAAADHALLLTLLRDNPEQVYFAGATIEGSECGDIVDIGTTVEQCSAYYVGGGHTLFSKKSVATESYSKCRIAADEKSCTAFLKEVGKTQHYESDRCDANKPLSSEPFYDWVCQ